VSTLDVKIKSGAGREASGPLGQVEAVIATLNVRDHDGDVATAETFTDGEEVIISSYNHASMIGAALPVGKGVIHVTPTEAILEGQFFMANASAREAFEVVHQMGAAQQWSYGYKILEAEPGVHAGEAVQFLRKVWVFEASPVIRGAGIATRTLDAKEAEALEQVRRIRDQHLAPPVDQAAREAAIREFLRFVRGRVTA
jgi:hypothetical protein